MPRKKPTLPQEQDEALEVRVTRGRGRPRNEDDPRLPMERGAIKDAGKVRKMPTKEQASADIFTLYARNLVANDGDIILAIMATLGKTREDVEANAPEYHDKIRSMSRAQSSVAELLEKHDVTREVRLAKVRQHAFSPNPAVSLKAIEMLDEMDMTAKASRLGGTWESFVRLAQEKASRK